jgi:hypothetical protein
MIIGFRHSRFGPWLIAAVALPLAAMPLPASAETMPIKFCSADGQTRPRTIPIDRENGDKSCAKPCHACLSRKKAPKG